MLALFLCMLFAEKGPSSKMEKSVVNEFTKLMRSERTGLIAKLGMDKYNKLGGDASLAQRIWKTNKFFVDPSVRDQSSEQPPPPYDESVASASPHKNSPINQPEGPTIGHRRLRRDVAPTKPQIVDWFRAEFFNRREESKQTPFFTSDEDLLQRLWFA